MESPYFLVGLASIVVLGIAAQWLAWRLRLPAILILLVFGCLAGPGTEWALGQRFLDPDKLLNGLVLPIVSLSVAVILFEGGLTLSLAELSQAGNIIFKLVSIGALVTWAIATVAAALLLGLDLHLALLLGAILVVTGPTVIGPLLRHVRPTGQVGAILKWEGIVIDPIGALLAVVVFEAIPTQRFGDVPAIVLGSVAKTVLVGSAIGLAGAVVLVVLLRKYWVADYLQSPVTLALALAAYTGSNLVQSESGLFAVTIMGIALANQKYAQVHHILEFKENLAILLVSGLFILLGARLQLSDLAHLRWNVLAFLAVLILVARPLSVIAATRNAGMSWRERIFLMCMAPRGIVAAAVSSVFALRLHQAGIEDAELLVPYTFAVIIGTVTVYGLLAGRAARWLGLSKPGRRGFLIAGANPVARAIATALQKEGASVLLVDTNRDNLKAARLAGLPTFYASILSQYVQDRVELSGIGRLLALTPNEEVNSLATLRFARIFGRSEVYQLASDVSDASRTAKVPLELRGRLLFGKGITYNHLASRLASGAVVGKTQLTREFDYKSFQAMHADSAIPMCLIDETGQIFIFTADKALTPKPGQTIISLMTKVTSPTARPTGAPPAPTPLESP